MALKNSTAIARLGDGIGTSMFIVGSEWQRFEGELFDGHNEGGETIEGLVCLRHAELSRELCFSTLFRELEELSEVKPNGTKVYKKLLRKGFIAKFYNAVKDRKNRTCGKFEKIFWTMLAEEFNLTYPTSGKFHLLLYLTTSKPVCKRKVNGNYVDQISIVTTIDGAKIEPIDTTTAPA